jgi:ribosomal-protein-alanine N-acetyltransferase
MEIVLGEQTFALEEMSLDDIPMLILIEKDCHFSPWSKKQFQSSIESSHQCWVLKHRDSIAAYIITSTAAGEAELLNITVAPAFQRRGLGTKALQAAIEHFDSSIETLFLEVRESNIPAIMLYHRLGFNEVGKRPNYYPAVQGREDAMIMAKPLNL